MDTTKHLLLVDDEPEILASYEMVLEGFVDKIFMAPNGAQALELLEKHPMHAVVTDLRMPVMGGIQLIHEVRMRGQLTPIVVISGHGDRDNTADALRLGAFDFLAKPVPFDALRKVVGRALDFGRIVSEVEEEFRKSKVVSANPSIRMAQLRLEVLKRARVLAQKGA